jgi:hypothetical protein
MYSRAMLSLRLACHHADGPKFLAGAQSYRGPAPVLTLDPCRECKVHRWMEIGNGVLHLAIHMVIVSLAMLTGEKISIRGDLTPRNTY